MISCQTLPAPPRAPASWRRRAVAGLLAAGIGATLAACGADRGAVSAPRSGPPAGEGQPPAPVGPPAPGALADVESLELEVGDVTGLSGLARDASGVLWAVAERKRFAVRIGPDRSAEPIPIEGVRDGLDLESMTWLPDGRLLLGTELGEDGRASDALLVARLERGALRVEEDWPLPYSLWPVTATSNHGAEGMCRAGDRLVVAVESEIGDGDARHGPLALYDLPDGRWIPQQVRLTSETGKLSSVACHARAGGAIDVLAIERHFGVARLLRFAIPAGARAGDPPLAAVLAVDLAPLLRTGSENFEGLVWDGADRITLVTDNHWTHVTGPTLLVTARLADLPPAPGLP